ncbi:MAG: hypothetical protein AAFQ82_25795 [Myxococcota bacterium]
MSSLPAHILLRRALESARTLNGADRPLTFVTCGYDTTFADLEQQVYRKLAQIQATYHDALPWRLLIVDDLPHRHRLSDAAQRAARRLGVADRLLLEDANAPRLEDGRHKGASLIQGFQSALGDRPETTIVYVNLNLKVHAGFSAPGVLRVWNEGHDAAIGTRAREEGGYVRGAGRLGRAKSAGFNSLVASVLPAIGRYRDTNAPMKVFSPRAAALLASEAVNSHITMDVEWLLLLHREGMDPVRYPVVWTQRPGSRPPWNRVPASAFDVLKMRSRF